MLRLLDARPGEKILEIGTGTGWTAALLSARLGSRNVVTLEIDPSIAARAANNLEQAGFEPRVVAANGVAGYKTEAPYDRVHVTCGVADIPYAWIEQTRDGGVIALPWMHGFEGGQKVKLTVNGGSATGRFYGETAYMMLRSQRRQLFRTSGEKGESTVVFDPNSIARSGEGFGVALSGLLPDVAGNIGEHDGGSVRIALGAADSYALIVRGPDDALSEIEQVGPRNLWDEVEAAYGEWMGLGCPGPERFGMTVDPHGQHIWLDHPHNRLRGV